MRALTAAVLFACYENMDGKRDAAVPHIVYARRLAKQCKDSKERSTYPTAMISVEPLIAHYEVQLGDYFGDAVPEGHLPGLDLLLPLKFSTLVAARVPLEKAIAELTSVMYTLQKRHRPIDITKVAARKANYADWLMRWDEAFTKLLAATRGEQDRETVNSCRILKAHQLAALILARLDYSSGESAWQAFDADFKAILDLLAEVLAAQPKKVTATSAPQTAYFSPGMGITEPLYCVATRCADMDIAGKAKSLLGRLPPNEGAYSAWRTSFIEAHLCGATGKRYEAPSFPKADSKDPPPEHTTPV